VEYSVSKRCGHGRQPDWPHYRFRLKKSEVKAATRSEVVKDDTRRLQAAIDEMNLGNSTSKSRNTGVLSPSEEYEEGESKAKKCGNVLCVHENKTGNQASILQLLDTGESSVGAQQQLVREEEDEKKVCMMNSSLQQPSVLTARVIDRGVKLPSTARVNNCLMVRRGEEVIKPGGH